MAVTRQTKKAKKVLIRDLSKTSLKQLDPNDLHVIHGGKVYTCGHEGDYCAKLTVVVSFELEDDVVIVKKGVARAKVMM